MGIKILIVYTVQLQILSIQVFMQYNSKSWPFRSLCSTTPNPDHSGPYAVQLQILTIQVHMQYNSKSWPFRSLCSTTPNPEHAESLCSTTPNPEHAESLYGTTPNPEHSDPGAEGLSVMWQLLNIIILPSYSLLDHLCFGEFTVKLPGVWRWSAEIRSSSWNLWANIFFKCSSYLEIYNEKVRDLLKYSSHNGRPPHKLRIREHPKDGPYVQGQFWMLM